MTSKAARHDQHIAKLQQALHDQKQIKTQLYNSAQKSVSANPYLKTVIDAYDTDYTKHFRVKKNQQHALQTLLQGLINTNLPAETIEYDRQLILAELRTMGRL